jgi:segregation and condensation protein B
MEAWEMKGYIEALLTAADRPVTLPALAECLDVTVEETEAALKEYEDDLLGADRGLQVHRRARGIRLEVKPRFADRIGRLIPAWRAKPLTSQAEETLAIIAVRQPCTIGDLDSIRGVASAATVQTLRNRKLIARDAQLGQRREKYWRTTPLFLETYNLTSLDEVHEKGCLEEILPSVFSAELPEDEEEVGPEGDLGLSANLAGEDDEEVLS